jgi:hypothetical protein
MTNKYEIIDLSSKKDEKKIVDTIKALIPSMIPEPIPAKDGKTPTKEELLALMKTVIPKINKNLTKGEIKEIIADYIEKSKVETPTLDFDMKETDQ